MWTLAGALLVVFRLRIARRMLSDFEAPDPTRLTRVIAGTGAFLILGGLLLLLGFFRE